MTLPDWTIQQDETGAWHAAGPLPVMMSVDAPGTLVKRRAVNSAIGEFACWLMGELDGVRTYVIIQDNRCHLLMTRQDLHPSIGGRLIEQPSVNGQG